MEMLAEDFGMEAGGFGDSFICRHGDEIEMDGECPQGCVSPLIEMGMI